LPCAPPPPPPPPPPHAPRSALPLVLATALPVALALAANAAVARFVVLRRERLRATAAAGAATGALDSPLLEEARTGNFSLQ
jgi:hypothetical protein